MNKTQEEIEEEIDSIINSFSWNPSKTKFIFNHNSQTLRHYHPKLLRDTFTTFYPSRDPSHEYIIYTGYDTLENITMLKDSGFGQMKWREIPVQMFRGTPILPSNTVTKTHPSELSDIFILNLTEPTNQINHAKIWDLKPGLTKPEINEVLLQISYRLNAIYVANNLHRSAVGENPTTRSINDSLQKTRILLERNGIEMDW